MLERMKSPIAEAARAGLRYPAKSESARGRWFAGAADYAADSMVETESNRFIRPPFGGCVPGLTLRHATRSKRRA
jgi:hypothetical protein